MLVRRRRRLAALAARPARMCSRAGRAAALRSRDYCTPNGLTNTDGSYNLSIPADAIGFDIHGELDGCTWQRRSPVRRRVRTRRVRLQRDRRPRSRSTPIPATGGLPRRHLRDGRAPRRDLGSECPDLHIQATVTYPEPPPPKETEEPQQEGPGAGPGRRSAPRPSPPGRGGRHGPEPPAGDRRFWRACGGGIRAHRAPLPQGAGG